MMPVKDSPKQRRMAAQRPVHCHTHEKHVCISKPHFSHKIPSVPSWRAELLEFRLLYTLGENHVRDVDRREVPPRSCKLRCLWRRFKDGAVRRRASEGALGQRRGPPFAPTCIHLRGTGATLPPRCAVLVATRAAYFLQVVGGGKI